MIKRPEKRDEGELFTIGATHYNQAISDYEKYHEQEIEMYKQTMESLDIEIDYLVRKSRDLPSEEEIAKILESILKTCGKFPEGSYEIQVFLEQWRYLKPLLAKAIHKRLAVEGGK